MARRRMFSLDIVDSDQFTDLPPTARLLYYELGVRADDDGFVGNPRKITRFAECSEDDIKMLEDKGFIYMFDSGVLAIRHWTVNNQLRGDRYHETYYKEEKKKVFMNTDNKTYYVFDDNGLPDGLPLVALDKIRIEKTNEEEKKEEELNSEKQKEEEYNSFDLSDIDLETKRQFEFLWDKYPKKIGKSAALYYYNKAIKNGESFDAISEGLDNYIKYIEENGTQDLFIKNASTWFKSECWNDEYETNNYYFNDVF